MPESKAKAFVEEPRRRETPAQEPPTTNSKPAQEEPRRWEPLAQVPPVVQPGEEAWQSWYEERQKEKEASAKVREALHGKSMKG